MANEATDIARKFLETLADPGFFGNLGGPLFNQWVEMVAEDARISFPYAPPGMAASFTQRKPWVDSILGVFTAIDRLSWVSLDVHATSDDPELVFATARGDAVTAAGRPYRNEYCFFLRVRNGKIVDYTEYFSPLVIAEAFAPAES